MLIAQRIPFVAVGNEYENARGRCVFADFTEVLEDVMARLEERGLLRVGFLLGKRGERGVKRTADRIFEIANGFSQNREGTAWKSIFKFGNIVDEQGYGAMLEFHGLPESERPQVLISTGQVSAGIRRYLSTADGWDPLVIVYTYSRELVHFPDYIMINYRLMGEYAYLLMERLSADLAFKEANNICVPLEVECPSLEYEQVGARSG